MPAENVLTSINKFIYFGFGSNMISQRIQIQNPTAVKVGYGFVKNYRLDFNRFGKRWQGAPATIVPTPNATVFGTLYEIDIVNLPDIDNQEGVHEGIYEALYVPVTLPNNTVIQARAYMLVNQPTTDLGTYRAGEVPTDRQPSKTYLQCLVKGAIESGIPQFYVEWLKKLQHNGNVAKEFEDILELGDVEL